MADVDMSAAASPSLPPSPPLRPPSITLTSTERELFAYLLRVREHARADSVELRVCGGWVRDKLLGRESSDIDIALDSMTGRAFVECINAFERACGRKERVMGVMRANPRQSKHLEVATVHLGETGQVDFVNMRAELFSRADGESEFGSPEQDAKCRDFTINSLFFNLSTQRIEDFTAQGVRDLRDRVLRTPIDARDILLDGPLCALRAVRFASQLDMCLHESLHAAIRLDEVKQALRHNVSRERVGNEFVRLLAAAPAQVVRAVQLLDELQLCRAILLPTTNILVTLTDGSAAVYANADGDGKDAIWRRCCQCAHEMAVLLAATASSSSSDGDSDSSSSMQKLRLLASFMLPFAGHRVTSRDVSVPLQSQVAKDVNGMILQHVPLLQSLVHTGSFDRVRVALLLREMRALWAVCRDVALASELVASAGRTSASQRVEIAARYSKFSANVEMTGLARIWEHPLLLSGKDVAQELGVTSGVAIRRTLERVFVWQLDHPDKSRADCLAHFRVANE